MSPIIEPDVERAAAANELFASATTTANENLIVDLKPTPTINRHWIVEHLTLTANLTVRAPATTTGFPPLTGLFLCPPNTPVEPLATAQVGWLQDARPFLLPMGLPAGDFGTIGAGPPFAFALVLAAGFKISVPNGWFLRAIVACAQGTATPGPGAGSIGRLRALCLLENDNPCA